MTLLLIAAIVWVVIHIGIAGTAVRRALASRLGEGGFRATFSVLSVASIALLCASYNRAPTDLLWIAPAWLLWVLAALMLVASIFFVGSVTVRNPTAIGGEGADVRGIVLLTRHPMLWSFAIWAAVHAVGNGDAASLLFFGAFLVTALAGMPSIDAKIAARDPAAWRTLAATTSIVPGARGWTLRRVGLVPIAGGLALWAVLFVSHPYLFGISPVR